MAFFFSIFFNLFFFKLLAVVTPTLCFHFYNIYITSAYWKMKSIKKKFSEDAKLVSFNFLTIKIQIILLIH